MTLDAAGLAGALGLDADSTVAARLLPVVTEAVNRYAPDAPDVMSDEAAVRYAAYLKDAVAVPNAAGSFSIGDIGPLTSSPHSHARAFTLSGAAALLSRYRKRRAGKAT